MESLLCSGSLDNIQLALVYLEGDMESSTHSMSSSVGSLGDSLIAYDHSVGKLWVDLGSLFFKFKISL